jgi:hypothetical protein
MSNPKSGDAVIFEKNGVVLYGVVEEEGANLARVTLVCSTNFLRVYEPTPAALPIDPDVYNKRPVEGHAVAPSFEVDYSK